MRVHAVTHAAAVHPLMVGVGVGGIAGDGAVDMFVVVFVGIVGETAACCVSSRGCIVGRFTIRGNDGAVAVAAVHIMASWLGDVVVAAVRLLRGWL